MRSAHALVLATGRLEGRLREKTGVPLKALLPFRGKPVLAHVLDVLREAAAIDEIVVISTEALRQAMPPGDGVRWLEEGPSKPENLRRGLRGLGLSTPVVILAGDLPLLTPAGIDALVEALPPGVDLGAPGITHEEFRAAYPAASACVLRLSDGPFVQPAAVVAKPQAIMMNYDLVLRAYAFRRRPLRLMRLLGWGSVGAYLLRRLSAERLCVAATRRLGSPCTPLFGTPPELAFRLSDPECFSAAQRLSRAGCGAP